MQLPASIDPSTPITLSHGYRRLLFIYIFPSVPRLRISVRTYTLAGGFSRVGPDHFRSVINAHPGKVDHNIRIDRQNVRQNYGSFRRDITFQNV